MAVFLADTTRAETLARFGRNDLQPCAAAYSRQHGTPIGDDPSGEASDPLGTALSRMASTFGDSRMSGSGSTVFSVLGGVDGKTAAAGADSQSDESHLRRLLATVPDDWIGRICHGLSEHPLVGWASD